MRTVAVRGTDNAIPKLAAQFVRRVAVAATREAVHLALHGLVGPDVEEDPEMTTVEAVENAPGPDDPPGILRGIGVLCQAFAGAVLLPAFVTAADNLGVMGARYLVPAIRNVTARLFQRDRGRDEVT